MPLAAVKIVDLTPGVWTGVSIPVYTQWVDVTIVNRSDASVAMRSDEADSDSEVEIVSGEERVIRVLCRTDESYSFVLQPDSGTGPVTVLWSLPR